MTPNKFPHGRCECSSGKRVGFRPCCGGEGPAAYAATRNGNPILLCTRCIISTDGPEALLVTLDDSIRPYRDHDKLGAALIMAELSSEITKEALNEQLDEVQKNAPERAEEVRKLKERLNDVADKARRVSKRN